MSILIAIVMFGVLIFVHELGHFLACRIFGVKVNEFAVGMGPLLFSRKGKKSGTTYSLRLLPIGGYNSIEGENGDSTAEDAFCTKPVWQRMIIIVSGALMNLLFAGLLMCILVGATERLGTTVIHSFSPDEGAVSTENYGLQVGDRILKINGKRVHTVDDMLYTVAFEATKPVPVLVERNGEEELVEGVVFPTYESAGVLFGTVDFSVLRAEKNLGTILRHSLFKCTGSMEMIWESLAGLVTGKFGLEQVSGPVGVTGALGDAARSGLLNVLNMVVLISLNLGIFNLLPIPALDGGRLVFLGIEAIRRKPIKYEIENMIHTVGITVLMLIMVVVTFKDIIFLFK